MVGWGWLYGVEGAGNKPHRCGAGRAAVCAPAARGRESGERRSGQRGQGQRDSIADGTALRCAGEGVP